MKPEFVGVFFYAILGTAILLIPAIFYLLTLRNALLRCKITNRAMPAGQVWLQLIPLFNLVWHFFIVLNVAKSLNREFEERGMKTNPRPGKSVGLAMCIFGTMSIIPYIGVFFGFAGFICWIIYWVKISGYSAQLA